MAATAEEDRQESWTRPKERFHVLVSPNKLKQELACFRIYLLILLTGMLSWGKKKKKFSPVARVSYSKTTRPVLGGMRSPTVRRWRQRWKAGAMVWGLCWKSGTTWRGKRRGSPAPSTALHWETHKVRAPASFYGGNEKHMGEGEHFSSLMEREMLPSMFEGRSSFPTSASTVRKLPSRGG